MKTPHIGISHNANMPRALLEEIVKDVAAPDLDVATEERNTEEEFWAGPEWLIPSAVVLFLTHSYFKGFLGEMGKEHYHLIKGKLWSRLLGPNGPKVTMVGSSGKVKPNPYSMAFSMIGELDDRIVKLMIQKDITEEQYELAVDSFIRMLASFHDGTMQEKTRREIYAPRDMGSRTTFMTYDSEKENLVVLDPFPQPPIS